MCNISTIICKVMSFHRKHRKYTILCRIQRQRATSHCELWLSIWFGMLAGVNTLKIPLASRVLNNLKRQIRVMLFLPYPVVSQPFQWLGSVAVGGLLCVHNLFAKMELNRIQRRKDQNIVSQATYRKFNRNRVKEHEI